MMIKMIKMMMILMILKKLLLVTKMFDGDHSVLSEPTSRAFTVIYMVLAAVAGKLRILTRSLY